MFQPKMFQWLKYSGAVFALIILTSFTFGTAAQNETQDECTSRVEALTLNTVDGDQEITALMMGDARLDPVVQTLDITVEATANTAANVRALPKRDAAVLVSLPQGTTVAAIGKVEFAGGEEWIQIQLPDSDALGWVYEPLLDNEADYDNVLPFNPDTLKPYYIIPSAYALTFSDAPCSNVVLQNTFNTPFRINLNALYIEWAGTLYVERDEETLSVALLQGSGQVFAPNTSTPIPMLPGASLSATVSPNDIVETVNSPSPLTLPDSPPALDALPVAVDMPEPLTAETIERLTMPNHLRIPANFSTSYQCELREVESPSWSASTGEVITLTQFSGCNADNRFLFQLSRTFPQMSYRLTSASEEAIVLGASGDIQTITLDPTTLKIRPAGYISSAEYSILVPLSFPIINVPQLHPNNPPPFSLIPSFTGGNVVYKGGYSRNVESKYQVEVTHTYTFNAFSGLLTRLEYEERMTACYFCVASISNRVPLKLVHLIWTLESTTMPLQ